MTLGILDALVKLTSKGVEKFVLFILAVAIPVVKGLSGSSVGLNVAPDVDGRFFILPSDPSILFWEEL